MQLMRVNRKENGVSGPASAGDDDETKIGSLCINKNRFQCRKGGGPKIYTSTGHFSLAPVGSAFSLTFSICVTVSV